MPAIPPSIAIPNITNITSVLEAVGKISEAIRLADEDAGEANTNKMATVASRQKKSSI